MPTLHLILNGKIMVLRNIQNYLAKHGKASLQEIAIHVKSDTEAVRPMLNRLITKGRIKRLPLKKCSGCCSCTPEALDIYEWVG